MSPQQHIDDVRIAALRPLIPPAILMEELPVGDRAAATVEETRRQVAACLDGADDRLVVVVGPCSIHDPVAALDYGRRLLEQAQGLRNELLILMRVYFEKPRTTVGWKGLINDPDLDDSFAINKGLRLARGVLRDLNDMGMPAGTEFLDTISPQFVADLVSWGAIGARTTECQTHRELASGLSMPVGFKNGTRGSVQIAVDAVLAAQRPHQFLSVTKQSVAAIVATHGNPHCHVILRGSADGPNYGAAQVAEAAAMLSRAGLAPRMMVDCSHGNSDKDHRRQPQVAAELANRIETGETAVCGLMIESHLIGGRQDVAGGKAPTYGQSITDACLGWDETVPLLDGLAAAVRTRRARSAS